MPGPVGKYLGPPKVLAIRDPDLAGALAAASIRSQNDRPTKPSPNLNPRELGGYRVTECTRSVLPSLPWLCASILTVTATVRAAMHVRPIIELLLRIRVIVQTGTHVHLSELLMLGIATHPLL